MNRSLVIALSALMLVLRFAGPASAGPNTWTPNGPEGGSIRAVLVDPTVPTTVYVGTVGSGIFKSIDGGVTWTQSGSPTDPTAGKTIRSLIFGAGGIIYAGSDNAVDSTSGVFQSVDSGASW